MNARVRTVRSLPLLFWCIPLLLWPTDLPAGTVGPDGRCSPAPLRRICIRADRELLRDHPVSAGAISDVMELLTEGFPGVEVVSGARDAQVKILLRLSRPAPDPSRRGSPGGQRDPRLDYPDHGYSWSSRCDRGVTVLTLRSPSPEGISFGLYGLLQERLGYKFFHPKRSILPEHDRWPLPACFRWSARPRFEKKGFHVHTLHPIELTEPIHDPAREDAFGEMKAYIDWLARNQQNMVQFFLLRTVDRKRWPAHAARIVRYAHQRGILAGVEVSLFMLQQNAFRLVHLPTFWRSYRLQADASLAWLFQAPWDFVTVDFTMSEYLPDLGEMMPGLREHIVERVTKRYGTKLLFTTHVIRGAGRQRAGPAGGESTGILIHTVMFYSLTDPSAPAYGNRDFAWMLDRARAEVRRQETWYWPESSYWIAFDSPVPILLLPYLDARLSDMATTASIGAKGHLTFTSGWEWGYWLIDWSIARWSWDHVIDGRPRPHVPLEYIGELMPGERTGELWRRALLLQKRYLKESGLIAFVSAPDPSAELPWPFNMPFQPRPAFDPSWLLYRASDAEARQALEGPVKLLEEYADGMLSVTEELKGATGRKIRYSPERNTVAHELIRALEVTGLRARHKALTLKALAAQRGKPHRWQPLTDQTTRLLEQASRVRREAHRLVMSQEAIYRFPVERIARTGKGHTSYGFGYLYPASDLFFWYRDEEQVRRRRFDAFFMNLWDFLEITGVTSLLDAGGGKTPYP